MIRAYLELAAALFALGLATYSTIHAFRVCTELKSFARSYHWNRALTAAVLWAVALLQAGVDALALCVVLAAVAGLSSS